MAGMVFPPECDWIEISERGMRSYTEFYWDVDNFTNWDSLWSNFDEVVDVPKNLVQFLCYLESRKIIKICVWPTIFNNSELYWEDFILV